MSHFNKRDLRRIPDTGRVAGVCSGIAEYLGWETWLVRIIIVSSFFFLGPLVLFAYIAAWVILEKKPASHKWSSQVSGQDSAHFEIKSKVWQAGEPPRAAFDDIKLTFETLESRLQVLERHITSKSFTVAREIDKL